MERKRWGYKRIREAGEQLGGSDIDEWEEYIRRGDPSCDRGGHRERSIKNDDRSGRSHERHWRDEENRGKR